MKASIVAVVAVAGLASAQFSGVPDCAQACLTSAISNVGCPITDVGCQCSSTDAIQATGAGCILGACTAPGDLQSAISGGLALCKAYLATASASATGSSSAAAATSSGSAAPASTSSEASSSAVATSTVSVQTTSVAPPKTTAPPVVANSTVVAPTGGVKPTPSPTVSTVPVNAGAHLVAGLGGLVGVFAAFIVAL